MNNVTRSLRIVILSAAIAACTPPDPGAIGSIKSTGPQMDYCKKDFKPLNAISVVLTKLQLDDMQAEITQQPITTAYPYGDPNQKTAAPPPENPVTPLDFGTALSGNSAKKREHILIVVTFGDQIDPNIKFHGDGLQINALEKNGKRMFCLRNDGDFTDRRAAFIAKYDNTDTSSSGPNKYTHGTFNINIVVPQPKGLSMPIALDPEVTNDGVIE